LQVTVPGDYTFYVKRANGGAWLGIDGYAIVQHEELKWYAGQACSPHWVDEHNSNYETELAGSVYLTSGMHEFEVIYYNRKGDSYNATCQVQYEGPDTSGVKGFIDKTNFLGIEHFSSAAGHQDEVQVAEVSPGYFAYDAAADLAVMAAGSCDLECRKGNMKHAALVFEVFCTGVTTVRFSAEVSAGAHKAMLWVDQQLLVWTLNATFDSTAAVGTSALSPATELAAGDHYISFQGRPTQFSSFGFRRLSIVEGWETCTFLIEGDKASECEGP
jgi:hypothetical protein